MNNIDDFLSHISKEDSPNDDWPELIQAMWWAKKGEWELAHVIAQDVESSDGSWYMPIYRVEGLRKWVIGTEGQTSLSRPVTI